jgi:hypothetical protein
MFITTLYLIKLFIAPQWWIPALIGLRLDLILYPAWIMKLLLSGKGQQLFHLTLQDKIYAAFVFWLVLSCLVNEQNSITNTLIVQYIAWFIMYKLFQASMDSIEEVRKISKILLFIILILVWEGIAHKLSADGKGWAGQSLGWVVQEVIDAGGSGRTQWVSIFDGPGVFCVVYTTALPFLLQYGFAPFKMSHRLLAWPLICAMMLAIYYTGSRGGFLGTMAIIGLFGAYKMKLSMSRLLLIVGAFVVVMLLAPSHLTSTRDSSGSAQDRVDMWGEGAEMVQHNPLFGIGRGNYGEYTGSLIAHNSAIEIMGELGFPGLFFWVSLIYLSLKQLLLYHRQSTDVVDQSYVAMLGISICGYVVSSMFVTLEYETFYFLFAICAIVGKNLKEEMRFSQREIIFIGMGCIGWFVFIKFFVGAYFGD